MRLTRRRRCPPPSAVSQVTHSEYSSASSFTRKSIGRSGRTVRNKLLQTGTKEGQRCPQVFTYAETVDSRQELRGIVEVKHREHHQPNHSSGTRRPSARACSLSVRRPLLVDRDDRDGPVGGVGGCEGRADEGDDVD